MDAVTGARRLSLQNLILPALTLGIRPLAIITQLTRSSMLDVLDQDYIRTAYAKGLRRRTVIWRHGLRNALNPVITAVTGWFAELLAGAFFVEYIFGWRGIGKVTVEALEKLDFPVVMGSVLVSAAFFIVINIVADVLYGIVDPRVRTK
jgi:peptide/nickel transport system permease protein